MIDVSFRLVDHGWLEAEVTGILGSRNLSASYLSDALSDFLQSVTVLLEGVSETQCVWYEEPGEYHWHFTRQGGEVEIKILWFEQPVKRSSRKGEVIFSSKDDIYRFARKVKRQYILLDTTDYSRLWSHVYPRELVQRLGEALKK